MFTLHDERVITGGCVSEVDTLVPPCFEGFEENLQMLLQKISHEQLEIVRRE
jgi:hypothetical protein